MSETLKLIKIDFVALLNFEMYIANTTSIKAVPMAVAYSCAAPVPNPIAIDNKMYPNSIGSFTGVLNLTIDNAPTNPSERASEDFTMVIITHTIKQINGNNKIIEFLEDTVLGYFLKCREVRIPKINATKRLTTNSSNSTWALKLEFS